MGSVAHFDEDKKEFIRDVHRYCRLDGKRQVGLDLFFVELKEVGLKKSVEAFSQEGDGLLRYQGQLCVPNINDLREKIISEAHCSRYFVHLGSIKMYPDLQEVY
ncbi:hypothetical protein MTR67_043363 [Solanum verrucosum]|uniref:Uncharacterized protein n=1 Tax=Solanum verrucosum TaxID=315347 RepID=A0AAF0UR67_SOLVR|nr:hypothetical protein MTR67_043363 [Solanum verrucosum]